MSPAGPNDRSPGNRGGRGDRTLQDRDGELDLDGFQEERVRPDLASRGPALLDLKARWQTLSARQQLRLKQLGVAGVIGALGLGLYSASGDKAEEALKAIAFLVHLAG